MIIETERLILRAWTLADADAMVAGLSDFEVSRNLVGPFPYTKQHAIEYINKHKNHTENDYSFAVTLKENGKVIGGTNLTINDLGRYAGGLWICREYQCKGYGTEIWIARAKFAFDILNQLELYNGFFCFNEKSQKMHTKIGYKVVSEKTVFCPALNTDVRDIITKLTKSDFEQYYNSINFKFLVK